MTALSFKKQFVEPIRRGLVSAYPDLAGLRPKRQTIRAGEIAAISIPEARSVKGRLLARPGEIISLYCGMRTQHCFKIADVRCVSLHAIHIEVEASRIIVDGKRVSPTGLTPFARQDGFEDWKAMALFWYGEHHATMNDFKGVLIRWEPLS